MGLLRRFELYKPGHSENVFVSADDGGPTSLRRGDQVFVQEVQCSYHEDQIRLERKREWKGIKNNGGS